MDFKSLISKIESIDGVIETPKAPAKAAPVRLDEDAELRVLAGVTQLTESFIAERAVKEEMKVGDTKKSSTGGTIEKTKTGVKHTAKDYDGSDHVEPAKKVSKAAMSGAERRDQKAADKAEEKKSKEWEKKHGKGSVTRHKMEDLEEASEKQKAAREKFLSMVNKKKSEKKDESVKEAKKSMKKDKKMEEAAKPDFLDMDKDGDKKEPMKKAVADKKKKTVKESVEQKLTLKDMLRIVKESGGQQAIDPVDQTLWSWANRVAASKVQESQKAEIFAAMIYERNGGRFEMYDVLSEDQK